MSSSSKRRKLIRDEIVKKFMTSTQVGAGMAILIQGSQIKIQKRSRKSEPKVQVNGEKASPALSLIIHPGQMSLEIRDRVQSGE